MVKPFVSCHHPTVLCTSSIQNPLLCSMSFFWVLVHAIGISKWSTNTTDQYDNYIKSRDSHNFSIGISTNTGKQLPHSCRGISTWWSNFGPHHRRSVGSRFWNTQRNSCFGGASALALAYGHERENSSQISPYKPQHIILSLYTQWRL